MNVRTAVAAVAASVFCGSVLTACGPANDDSDPSGSAITITDSADRELEVDSPPERVAVLDIGVPEAMRAFGELDRLVGSHEALEDDPLWEDISDLPVVATYSETSYEKLAETKPDLVFSALRAHGMVTDHELLDGFDISDFKISLRRPELMKDEITTLGKIFDAEDTAQQLVDFYTDTEKQISDKIDDVPDEDRPSVFVEYHAGAFNTDTDVPEEIWGYPAESQRG